MVDSLENGHKQELSYMYFLEAMANFVFYQTRSEGSQVIPWYYPVPGGFVVDRR